MQPFAHDRGDSGAPFTWDETAGRRSVPNSTPSSSTSTASTGTTSTHPRHLHIVKRKDEAKYGTYHAKNLILAEYDRMAVVGVRLTMPVVDGENYTFTSPRSRAAASGSLNRAAPSRPETEGSSGPGRSPKRSDHG